jgi:hypothetical protein
MFIILLNTREEHICIIIYTAVIDFRMQFEGI